MAKEILWNNLIDSDTCCIKRIHKSKVMYYDAKGNLYDDRPDLEFCIFAQICLIKGIYSLIDIVIDETKWCHVIESPIFKKEHGVVTRTHRLRLMTSNYSKYLSKLENSRHIRSSSKWHSDMTTGDMKTILENMLG